MPIGPGSSGAGVNELPRAVAACETTAPPAHGQAVAAVQPGAVDVDPSVAMASRQSAWVGAPFTPLASCTPVSICAAHVASFVETFVSANGPAKNASTDFSYSESRSPIPRSSDRGSRASARPRTGRSLPAKSHGA